MGVGVAEMHGKCVEAYDDLKQTLFTDLDVVGKAVTYVMVVKLWEYMLF